MAWPALTLTLTLTLTPTIARTRAVSAVWHGLHAGYYHRAQALTLTLSLAQVWHGLHAGYYLCFACMFAMLVAEQM